MDTMNRDTEEKILVETFVLINGKWVRQNEWVSKSDLAVLGEEIESAERILRNAQTYPTH